MTAEDDDRFWLFEADPDVDICDRTLTVGDCLNVIVPALEQHVDLGAARILEIGCGIGRLTVPLQQVFPGSLVMGVDISDRFLSIAMGVSGSRPAYLRGGSLDAVPTGSVDAAYTMCVFQHIDGARKREYIRGVSRVLRPGGVLVAQFVEGEDVGRCLYDAATADMAGWCGDAGLTVTDVRHDLLMPRWTWLTAVRPQ